jgi:hypothetical protein
VDDIVAARHFYGEILGLPRNEHLDHEDWIEYEASNVTLAVMTPETHDDVFAAFPPGTIALGVPTSPPRRPSSSRRAWRSARCGTPASVAAPASATRPGTGSSSTTGTRHMTRSDALAAYEKLPLPDTTEEHWRFTNLRGFDPDSFEGAASAEIETMLDLDVSGYATVTADGIEIEKAAPEGITFAPLPRTTSASTRSSAGTRSSRPTTRRCGSTASSSSCRRASSSRSRCTSASQRPARRSGGSSSWWRRAPARR